MADLHFSDAEPTASERGAVLCSLSAADDCITAPDSGAVAVVHPRVVRGGTQRRKQLRHQLLPALHALQHEAGWISPGGLNFVGRTLGVPPAEAYGVATFYEMFRTEPPDHLGSVHHVCIDPICAMAGADRLADELAAGGHAVHRAPCLGQCERAPAEFVQGLREPDRVPADEAGTPSLVRSATAPMSETLPCLLRHMLRPSAIEGDPGDGRGSSTADAGHLGVEGRSGPRSDSALAADHAADDAGAALDAALRLGPDEVISQVGAAGLSGRGGAAFPTGIKWRAVADGDGPKHVVANIDESEPGTFKDRLLCELAPLAIIESITVAGLTVGAEHGWIYIRGEYPLATQRLTDAIAQAHRLGWLGDDAAGSGRSFDIELRRGAGAYICGEETALFNSLEGFRGEPRNKPPFPTTHGLFGRPTAVNNPETLLNVSEILRLGPEAYRSVGTEGSPGTKLFCLSGRIGRPGLYEAPFGTPLGELLSMAGGVQGTLRAVLLGGAAGSFVGPDALDLPLSLEDTRAADATLGSGPVMVFDDTADMAAVVERLARFFRDESCGQCVPCRVGTVRQHELVTQIRRAGRPAPAQSELLDDIAAAMGDASICGLGHTAASAVLSAMRLGLLESAPA